MTLMAGTNKAERLAVGVVGCGSLAQATHLPHLNELPNARLAWACEVDPVTRDTVAAQFRPERITDDYLEVLRDPGVDAIVLATDQTLRLPVIRAAAEAGKPLYCEKPMADYSSRITERLVYP